MYSLKYCILDVFSVSYLYPHPAFRIQGCDVYSSVFLVYSHTRPGIHHNTPEIHQDTEEPLYSQEHTRIHAEYNRIHMIGMYSSSAMGISCEIRWEIAGNHEGDRAISDGRSCEVMREIVGDHK